MRKYIREVGVLDPAKAEKWLSKFKHPKTFNNNLVAIRKLFKFYGVQLNIKQKDARPHGLVLAPTMDEVKSFLMAVDRKDVRLYLLMLALQGIRPERLLKLEWSEVDLTHGWIIPRDGNVRSKFYRPQPIHPDLVEHLKKMKLDCSDRVFNFAEVTVRRCMERAWSKTGRRIRRADLRKFFYNKARKTMRFEIVEWLMGHQLGVVQHYLADEIMEEYLKFAETVKPLVETLNT